MSLLSERGDEACVLVRTVVVVDAATPQVPLLVALPAGPARAHDPECGDGITPLVMTRAFRAALAVPRRRYRASRLREATHFGVGSLLGGRGRGDAVRADVRLGPRGEGREELRAVRFRVLGSVEIESDDGPVVVSGQRLRALLTALLLQPNSVVSTDRLVEALWGQDLPESPANALHQVVTRLRARLGRWADCVRTGPGGYVLVAPDGSIDAEVFEGTYRRARTLMDAGSDRADTDQADLARPGGAGTGHSVGAVAGVTVRRVRQRVRPVGRGPAAGTTDGCPRGPRRAAAAPRRDYGRGSRGAGSRRGRAATGARGRAAHARPFMRMAASRRPSTPTGITAGCWPT